MRISVSLFILVVPMFCFSANDYVGKVSGIRAEAGYILISLKDGNGAQDCGSGNKFWVEADDEFGQAILSLALVAKTTQSRVYVLGHSACETAWPYKDSRKVAVFNLTE